MIKKELCEYVLDIIIIFSIWFCLYLLCKDLIDLFFWNWDTRISDEDE